MQAIRSRLNILLLSVVLVSLLSGFRGEAPNPQTTGTYKDNRLALSIPYHAPHAGPGTLSVELIDPEDQVLGRADRKAEAVKGDGVWKQDLKPADALPFADLMWQRIRIKFQYTNEQATTIDEIHAVSDVLRRPVVHIIGQSSYLAGARAAVRVIVTDSDNHEIAGNSTIRVELIDGEKAAQSLFEGRANRRGTTDAQFHFPGGLIGNYQLHFIADTPLGTTETTQPVRLEDKASILLTTEKRMYQPGQTIHVRTLLLDRAEHHAVAAKPLLFEILDPRGNKVFKQSTTTDEFGIASCEFPLADEVNLGAYQLHALMGNPESPGNRADLTFTVDRYVLPKFKVAVNFTAANGKPKRDYRPGDHVTGTVQANYFFGKPVSGSDITVKASSMDVQVTEAASAAGHTDSDGTYHFDLRLPAFFAGRSANSGSAPVLIEASVKDSSGHAETHDEGVTVSDSPLLVTAIPESGTLIPGLENQIYVLASYADGTPALADIHVRNQTVTTDQRGVAIVRLTPDEDTASLKIRADDHQGNHTSVSVPLQLRQGADQVLLRADRAVYKAGDRMQLSVFSTKTRGTTYVDIVKDGQTVLTRDLDIANSRADLNIVATPEMTGTLDIHAYGLADNGQTSGDHRMVFVQPSGELHIQAVADAPVYKPGADARIQFRVTNEHGQGVRAALGLQVVDESVFALAEKQPGFAKVFFYLEQQLLQPRYEIHSLSLPEVIEPTEEAQDRAAKALFSATEMTHPNQVNVSVGKDMPQEVASEYQQRYREAFETHISILAANPHVKSKSVLLEADGSKPSDAWGTPLQIESTRWPGGNYLRISSAGIDRQFNTQDDFSCVLDARSGTLLGRTRRSTLDIKLSHQGSTEVIGTILDASGAAVQDATVTLAHKTTTTNLTGLFKFSGVAPGGYRLEVRSPGFTTASKWLTLQSGDRAQVSGILMVGSLAQTVGLFEMRAAVAGVMGGAPRALQMSARAVTAFKANAPLPEPPSPTQQAEETHVRSYFPEALYINPEIITDKEGSASIFIPMADSITNWRMTMLASTPTGAIGTANSAIKVFQDFFVDLDLPVTLTQGDRITIPVAIYNYAGQRGDVKLSLEQDGWFGLPDDSPQKSVSVQGGAVGSSSFSIEARQIGKFKLKLSAAMDGAAHRQDIVVREIEVVPNGREQNIVFNGHLDSATQQTVRFPTAAIPDASKLFVRLYPGPLSQVMEGMDAILRMPGGCFEQTSSSTYPNILALDYMKRTKKLTPEVHAKAEGFIVNGYQRLLTFEVAGGGFSWFGRAPANKILTAYGLMEFHDMSKVHDVDDRLIQRTSNWLVSQQQSDGSWLPDKEFINEGATNRYNSDAVRITAYIAWALGNSGYHGPAIDKARQFISGHLNGKLDSYTLAVLANLAVETSPNTDFARRVMAMLLDARVEKGEQVFWNSEETGVYSTGSSAVIETTGLAAQALLKWHQSPDVTRKALAYIAATKDSAGTWGTTQATIMALHAMLMASEESSSDVRGDVQVVFNGKPIQSLTLTQANSDLYRQFVLPADQATNNIEISFKGSGGLAYQIVGRYFVPWESEASEEALSINVAYDRTKLAQNETVNATASIRNNLDQIAKMVMVDLGIPPGFELLTEDLDSFKEKTAGARTGSLEKFSLTATQAILYFNGFAPRSTVTLHFRLRAKYPIRAHNFESKAYEYYNPSVSSIARPRQFEVTRN